MAKRNRVLLGILVAAVLALLIALCFVGNTFARYTLKQEESVTVEIAEWEITLEDSSNETGGSSNFASSVSGLKPSADEFGDTARQTKAGEYFVCVAKLTNTGDVAADVTLAEESVPASDAEYETFSSVDELVAKGSAYGVTSTSDNYTEVVEDGSTTGYTYTPNDDSGYAGNDETTGSAYAGEIGSHITADVYYDTEGALTSDSEESKLPTTGVTLYPQDTATEGQTSSIYIYLDIIWLSDLTVDTSLVNGDGFDTWCGTWVTGFSFGLTIEAVQTADNT